MVTEEGAAGWNMVIEPLALLPRMKVTMSVGGGRSARVAVEVVPVVPGVHMVEFARRSGDTLAFHELVRQLAKECGALAPD